MNDQHETLIAELESIPARMAAAARQVAGLPQPEGEWSPRTILIHMSAGDVEIWQARLKMMAEQDNPQWQWTEPDIPAWEARFEGRTLDELAAEFARTRAEIVAHLRALDPAGWERTGTHTVFGRLDVAALCGRLLHHDHEHLDEMQRRTESAAPRITDADG